MVAKRQERNIITYSSLIAAADRTGRWEEGLTIWGHMSGDRCHPNLPAYNSAISCCAQGLLSCCAVLCCAALCCAALCCAMVLLASNAAVHAGLRYAWPAIISLTVNCSSQLGSTCDSVNMMCSNSCCCCAGGREAKHFASTKFTFLGRRAPPQRRDRFCSNITIDLVGIVALETQLCCVSQVRSGSMQVTSLSR